MSEMFELFLETLIGLIPAAVLYGIAFILKKITGQLD